MTDMETISAKEKKVYSEESIRDKYGIRSLSKPKSDRRKVTKESVAFCCSKSALDERDINQCTQCVI
jgi:hypothetical protein